MRSQLLDHGRRGLVVGLPEATENDPHCQTSDGEGTENRVVVVGEESLNRGQDDKRQATSQRHGLRRDGLDLGGEQFSHVYLL